MSTDLLVFCLIVAAGAVLVFLRERALIHRSIRVSGEVLEHLRVEYYNPDGRDRVALHLRISYRTASGELMEFESSASPTPPPAVGETVSVLYDPKDPTEVRMENQKFRHWEESIVFVISMVGVLMFLYERFVR